MRDLVSAIGFLLVLSLTMFPALMGLLKKRTPRARPTLRGADEPETSKDPYRSAADVSVGARRFVYCVDCKHCVDCVDNTFRCNAVLSKSSGRGLCVAINANFDCIHFRSKGT